MKKYSAIFFCLLLFSLVHAQQRGTIIIKDGKYNGAEVKQAEPSQQIKVTDPMLLKQTNAVVKQADPSQAIETTDTHVLKSTTVIVKQADPSQQILLTDPKLMKTQVLKKDE